MRPIGELLYVDINTLPLFANTNSLGWMKFRPPSHQESKRSA